MPTICFVYRVPLNCHINYHASKISGNFEVKNIAIFAWMLSLLIRGQSQSPAPLFCTNILIIISGSSLRRFRWERFDFDMKSAHCIRSRLKYNSIHAPLPYLSKRHARDAMIDDVTCISPDWLSGLASCADALCTCQLPVMSSPPSWGRNL